MKCKTLHRNLIFYLDGDLSSEEIREFDTHLSECSDCAAFALEMKNTLEIIETEKEVEINPFFYTRVKAKLEIRKSEQQAKPWQPIFTKVLQPAFFSIILLLGVYGGIKLGQPSPSAVENNILAEQEMIPYLNEMAAEPIEAFLMK